MRYFHVYMKPSVDLIRADLPPIFARSAAEALEKHEAAYGHNYGPVVVLPALLEGHQAFDTAPELRPFITPLSAT